MVQAFNIQLQNKFSHLQNVKDLKCLTSFKVTMKFINGESRERVFIKHLKSIITMKGTFIRNVECGLVFFGYKAHHCT